VCASCLSGVDVVFGQGLLMAAVAREHIGHVLAGLGILAPRDQAFRDDEAAAFLSALGLDVAEILPAATAPLSGRDGAG
jgi:hypothetical protein